MAKWIEPWQEEMRYSDSLERNKAEYRRCACCDGMYDIDDLIWSYSEQGYICSQCILEEVSDESEY